MQNTQIIILAAGKGTRMKSDEPKTMTLFRGKPFLEHILATVDSLGLPIPPIIVVGHKKESIIKKFGEGRVYAEQPEMLGTGHAVSSAKAKAHKDHDTVLVLCGDQPLISAETIKKILEQHEKKHPAITMATLPLPDFEEWRKGLRHFGRILRDTDGRIAGIVEYNEATEKEKLIKEINPSVYAFDADWLWKNIDLLRNDNVKGEYYLTDIIRIASGQGKPIESAALTDIIEGLQPNTMEEVALMERITG